MGTEDSFEIVYVLVNPAMPGLTKIGKTLRQDISSRLSQLYTTGVPVPFECVYACQVKDGAEVEQALQVAFGNARVNPKREFFKTEPEQVIAILKLLAIKDVTPSVEKEMSEGLDPADRESREDLARMRRPRMNFQEMEIPPGAMLLYRDGKTQVEVVDDHQVRYGESVCSLTAVTRKLMDLSYSVQPAPHWTYKGRSLKEIYEEVHSTEED